MARYISVILVVSTIAISIWIAQGVVLWAIVGCPGTNPNDFNDDSIALQACLDAGGTIELVPGNPGYMLRNQGLVLKQASTFLTSSQRPTRARIFADAQLTSKMLVTNGAGVNNFQISDLIFDGNRSARDIWGLCQSSDNRPANLDLRGNGFWVHHVTSENAPCGSGMGIGGTNFTVTDNLIQNNGFAEGEPPGAPNQWADGMTVVKCNSSTSHQSFIHQNTFSNNTDIDLVIGGGPKCSVKNNVISHTNRYAFAGLAIGNFPDAGTWRGKHTGSVFQLNNISSGLNLLGIGLLVGTHPWDTTPAFNVSDAGQVLNNTVSGAVINLVVEGIAAGSVQGNSMSGAQGSNGLGSCTFSANYTAHHFGTAAIQCGWQGLEYDEADNENPCVQQGFSCP